MTEYKKYDELKGHTLEKGDRVVFVVGDVAFYYTTASRYLSHDSGTNSRIFKTLNLNKNEFCAKIYGHGITEGDSEEGFPETNDYTALTNVVLELFALIEGKKSGKGIKPLPIDKHLVLVDSCQNFVGIRNSYKEAEELAKTRSNENVTIYKIIDVAKVQSERIVKRVPVKRAPKKK